MTESELADQRRFLNRLKILRSIDHVEVPEVLDWPAFRDNPPEYFIRCGDAEADHIWAALLAREPTWLKP